MKPILEKRMKNYKGIRGLRICQNEDCKLPQNRDRTGASNVGLQFARLFAGRGPIRSMISSCTVTTYACSATRIEVRGA